MAFYDCEGDLESTSCFFFFPQANHQCLRETTVTHSLRQNGHQFAVPSAIRDAAELSSKDCLVLKQAVPGGYMCSMNKRVGVVSAGAKPQ